jgi:hypothetical protein
VAFSFGAWFLWATDTTAFQTFFDIHDSGFNGYSEIYIDDTTGLLTISMFAGDTAFGATPVVGDWFYLGLSCAGTGANQFVARWWDDTFTLQSTATRTSPSFTPISMSIGDAGPPAVGDILQGNVSCARVWDAALSQAELEAEMISSAIVRTANINTAFQDDFAVDVSGNSRPWSTDGAPAISSAIYPPITFANPDGPHRIHPTRYLLGR